MIYLFIPESGEIIKNGLSKRTGAQALDNLTEIVNTVDEVRSNVFNVEKASKGLKEKVERLKNGLTDSKSRLLTLLDQCQTEKCSELKNMPEIRSLRVQNEFQNVSFVYSWKVIDFCVKIRCKLLTFLLLLTTNNYYENLSNAADETKIGIGNVLSKGKDNNMCISAIHLGMEWN